MKVLAIGNSFSEDAVHYLHPLAEADGRELYVVNLMIGGCPLMRHWNNIEKDLADYDLQINGFSAGKKISVREALATEDWDVIVTQQASHDSGLEQTYHPYLENVVAYLREKKPNARIYLQKTWAYETDSLHDCFSRYDRDQQKMYLALSAAYENAAKTLSLPLIPSADVIQSLRSREPFLYGHGGMSLCRDGFHMNLIYGRYLLAAVWYRTFTGRSVSAIPYLPHTPLAPNAVCDEKVLRVIQSEVDALCSLR